MIAMVQEMKNKRESSHSFGSFCVPLCDTDQSEPSATPVAIKRKYISRGGSGSIRSKASELLTPSPTGRNISCCRCHGLTIAHFASAGRPTTTTTSKVVFCRILPLTPPLHLRLKLLLSLTHLASCSAPCPLSSNSSSASSSKAKWTTMTKLFALRRSRFGSR